MWNVTQPATSAQVIGKHDAPIKCLKFITEMSMVATGSWDKTVKLWDARSPNPVAQAQVGERVYAMDKHCKNFTLLNFKINFFKCIKTVIIYF